MLTFVFQLGGVFPPPGGLYKYYCSPLPFSDKPDQSIQYQSTRHRCLSLCYIIINLPLILRSRLLSSVTTPRTISPALYTAYGASKDSSRTSDLNISTMSGFYYIKRLVQATYQQSYDTYTLMCRSIF